MQKTLMSMAMIVVMLSVVLPLAGMAGPLDWMKPPPDISQEGYRVDSLFYLVTTMLLVLFGIMAVLLCGPMIRHRDGKSTHEVHYHHGTSRKDLLIAGAISGTIFFVVDGTLLVNSWDDINNAFWNYPRGREGITRVEIMPQQWAWNVRYPGDDGTFNTADDIVTLNDLRIPVDKPLLVQLTSKDVIHSFSLPSTRRKQDAIPGTITRFTFTPKETGSYEIVCAEMCGLQHYKMRGVMRVYPEDDYKKWHREATRFAIAGYDPEDEEARWGWEWEEAK